MDSFGINATPIGGSAGRCDAMVAVVESQAADGVIHVHLFMYMEHAMQFSTFHDLARLLRDKMLSAAALKHFVSHVRCAAYPDVAAHREDRAKVEKDTKAQLQLHLKEYAAMTAHGPFLPTGWKRSDTVELQRLMRERGLEAEDEKNQETIRELVLWEQTASALGPDQTNYDTMIKTQMDILEAL